MTSGSPCGASAPGSVPSIPNWTTPSAGARCGASAASPGAPDRPGTSRCSSAGSPSRPSGWARSRPARPGRSRSGYRGESTDALAVAFDLIAEELPRAGNKLDKQLRQYEVKVRLDASPGGSLHGRRHRTPAPGRRRAGPDHPRRGQLSQSRGRGPPGAAGGQAPPLPPGVARGQPPRRRGRRRAAGHAPGRAGTAARSPCAARPGGPRDDRTTAGRVRSPRSRRRSSAPRRRSFAGSGVWPTAFGTAAALRTVDRVASLLSGDAPPIQSPVRPSRLPWKPAPKHSHRPPPIEAATALTTVEQS